MSNLKSLKDFIKFKLKERQMTYKDLAKALNVSEVTVKRWLSSADISLRTLEQIGQILEFDLFGLLKSDFAKRSNYKYYTESQEQFLASHPLAFFIFIKLAFNFKVAEILAMAQISEAILLKQIKLLEKARLLERWPGDKIKFKLKGIFRAQSDGPLMKKYHPLIASGLMKHFSGSKYRQRIEYPEFPDCSLFRPTELYLSRSSAFNLTQELNQTLGKYARLGVSEKNQGLEVHPTSVIVGVSMFDIWAQVLLEQGT